MGLIPRRALDIQCCIISTLHLHLHHREQSHPLSRLMILIYADLSENSVARFWTDFWPHTVREMRSYSYIHTQSNLLLTYFLSHNPSRIFLIIRLHNCIASRGIPKLTPFTFLPPIRFLKSSSMWPRFVSAYQPTDPLLPRPYFSADRRRRSQREGDIRHFLFYCTCECLWPAVSRECLAYWFDGVFVYVFRELSGVVK